MAERASGIFAARHLRGIAVIRQYNVGLRRLVARRIRLQTESKIIALYAQVGNVDLSLVFARRLGDSAVGATLVAAHKFVAAIHHHLRRVSAVQAKAIGVIALPLAVKSG